MQLNKEIADAISNVHIADPNEEEDLDEMFAELEHEEMDRKMISAPAAPISTKGQTVKPSKDPGEALGHVDANLLPVASKPAEEDEEEELRKLQAEMAM